MREEIARYRQAAAVLPLRLREAAETLPDADKAAAEELRLRAGRPMTVLLPGGERAFRSGPVTWEELEDLCDRAAEYSRYAAAETLREGYLPVRGGFRLGLCGCAVMKDGVCTGLRDLSAAVLRIAREKRGLAERLMPALAPEGLPESTLILSPPGGGKTTLLRDLVRCVSERGVRVGLADERGEVAVTVRGAPQMDVGPATDVLDGCPKALAIPMLLRAMNPQVIAVDEITAPADIQAMVTAANCGVRLLATIHAAGPEELQRKPLYAELLAARVFRRTVCILRRGRERVYQTGELPW